MTIFRTLFGWLLPEDGSNDCGYGPFKLPHDHPFTRACVLHDGEFQLSHEGKQTKTEDEVDADLFWRWAMIARAASTFEEQTALMRDICEYWPLARIGGPLLWDGK